MMFLKQSTASQSVIIGPFIDDTDGKTAEIALTIANTDIRLSKNGGNMAAKNSGGGTHDEAGWYTITLDATDTNTVGRLQVSIHVSGALPVWHEFQVLEEDIYEALVASGAAAFNSSDQVTVAGFAADAINAAAIAANAIGASELATDAVAEIADGVLDEVVENSKTMRQLLRLMLAALVEKSAGGGTSTITFRDDADLKNRISATVDASGNRTAVVLDGS
jgi:hypothetical protein